MITSAWTIATIASLNVISAQEPGGCGLWRLAPFLRPGELDLESYERIILTGMGASLIASHPTWSSLVAEGRPAWLVSTAHFLATPELVTPGSLLWVTSQSGESGEVVALVNGRGGPPRRPATLSHHQRAGQRLGPSRRRRCGPSLWAGGGVSTKSYISTLAAHDRALSALRHHDDAPVRAHIGAVADELAHFGPDVGLSRFFWAGLRSPPFRICGHPTRPRHCASGGPFTQRSG